MQANFRVHTNSDAFTPIFAHYIVEVLFIRLFSVLAQAHSQPIFQGGFLMCGDLNIRRACDAPRHTAVCCARGRSGRGRPPPGSQDPGVSPTEIFETETPRKTFWNWNVRRPIITHTKGSILWTVFFVFFGQ